MLLGLALLAPCHAARAESQWARDARRFSGESERVRADAIADLRKIPHLEALLKKGLRGDERFLALDVISALKLRDMLPLLLELAPNDESGFFYQASSSLLTPAKEDEVRALFHARIVAKKTAPAAKVVLLDTYGRMRGVLRPSDVESLLSDSNPDVRSAALSYLRTLILRFGEARYAPLLDKAAEDESYSLRIQAYCLASELPGPLREQRDRLLNACKKDEDARVRAVCADLGRKKGKGA